MYMAKKFQLTERALKRLQLVENIAAFRDNHSELTTDEEILAFGYGCLLTHEDVSSVFRCSVKTLSTLGLPTIRLGNTVRYSADMVRDYISRTLIEQADERHASRTMGVSHAAH
jgi:hypothetical protein